MEKSILVQELNPLFPPLWNHHKPSSLLSLSFLPSTFLPPFSIPNYEQHAIKFKLYSPLIVWNVCISFCLFRGEEFGEQRESRDSFDWSQLFSIVSKHVIIKSIQVMHQIQFEEGAQGRKSKKLTWLSNGNKTNYSSPPTFYPRDGGGWKSPQSEELMEAQSTKKAGEQNHILPEPAKRVRQKNTRLESVFSPFSLFLSSRSLSQLVINGCEKLTCSFPSPIQDGSQMSSWNERPLSL